MAATTIGPAAQVLAASARALAGVVVGQSADAALVETAGGSRLGAAVRAVTLGTLRWYPRLAALVNQLRERRTLHPTLHALLAAALFQLEYSRNPPEAAVSSAVDATRLLGQPRAAGLVNALLRRFRRERETLLAQLPAGSAAALAHPPWLLQALQADWPHDWPAIVAANNAQAPMALRVDLSRKTREAAVVALAARNISALAPERFPAALVLEHPVAVGELPGFSEGWLSVQDAGAQLAARLLQVRPGERVLDGCAAPGGKTGALLEAAGDALDLTALDIDAARLARVAENLERLGRSAQLLCADLADPAAWWDGTPFDAILLDAPCSSVGVIRRHPDIKLLRRAADIPALAQLQIRLLTACFGLLSPGGRLLYSTCSVLRAENDAVIGELLAAHPQVRARDPLELIETLQLAGAARPCAHGIQLLPGGEAGTDGFYYACLTVT